MKYLPIESDLFIQNRKRFVEQLKPNSIAVFNSNDIMPTSADGIHAFIQQTQTISCPPVRTASTPLFSRPICYI